MTRTLILAALFLPFGTGFMVFVLLSIAVGLAVNSLLERIWL